MELYTEKEVYRPFWEKDSALLETELGCSWHKCAFCDFTKDDFYIFPLEEIEKKAKMLVPYAKAKRRIFLLGENPFVMDTGKILAITGYVERYMPWIHEISMYARVDDVLRKDERELLVLREKGICHLHIGIESGNAKVLKQMNKGVTPEQGIEACERLHRAGITYSVTVIPGLGGKKMSEEHAEDTAKFLNVIQPERIWMIGLKIWNDTELYKQYNQGLFVPLDLRSRMMEAKKILENLKMSDCIFADTTVLNKYTVIGKLPYDKEKMINWMNELAKGTEN